MYGKLDPRTFRLLDLKAMDAEYYRKLADVKANYSYPVPDWAAKVIVGATDTDPGVEFVVDPVTGWLMDPVKNLPTDPETNEVITVDYRSMVLPMKDMYSKFYIRMVASFEDDSTKELLYPVGELPGDVAFEDGTLFKDVKDDIKRIIATEFILPEGYTLDDPPGEGPKIPVETLDWILDAGFPPIIISPILEYLSHIALVQYPRNFGAPSIWVPPDA